MCFADALTRFMNWAGTNFEYIIIQAFFIFFITVNTIIELQLLV